MMMAAEEPIYPYLTFEAASANSTVQMVAQGNAPAMSLEYNIGGGWLPYTVGDTITLANIGDSVKMRGTNVQTATAGSSYNSFVMTGTIMASGDITSIINGQGGDVTLGNYCLFNLFINCASLITPPNLPSTHLGNNTYRSLFQGCTGLAVAPVLPATTVGQYCYYQILSGCTGLTVGSYLKATTLSSNCYYYAFTGCTNITSHHVATLNNSPSVFNNNSSCVELVIDDAVPPTISSITLYGLKSDCIIYVPAGSVAAYQAAQYWSARAAYIQANPNT